MSVGQTWLQTKPIGYIFGDQGDRGNTDIILKHLTISNKKLKSMNKRLIIFFFLLYLSISYSQDNNSKKPFLGVLEYDAISYMEASSEKTKYDYDLSYLNGFKTPDRRSVPVPNDSGVPKP